MTLHPQPIPPIPAETARIARAAFPRGTLCLRMRDELGAIYTDDAFADLFAARGRPAIAPWRLLLISILQFVEHLSDRQAADAVRSRIDWKYLLSLDLSDAGFDASVLSEFRARLVAGSCEEHCLTLMLDRLRDQQLLKARGRQRTDSTHVLAAIHALNRVEVVGETLRHVLNTLATVGPAWLQTIAEPAWADRYARRIDTTHLPKQVKDERALIDLVGADGRTLLAAVSRAETPDVIRQLPAVEMLRQVWVQNYYADAEQVRWRTKEDLPPAGRFISSPYDVDARYAQKRSTSWIGYKVHLTETCDADLPHLITHVETTPAPVDDSVLTSIIHTALAQQRCLPGIHIVDTGYTNAALIMTSRRDYQVDLVGPTRPDRQWQARADQGFAIKNFQIDWDKQPVTCPAGHRSQSWSPAVDGQTQSVIKIHFSYTACKPCVYRDRCTRSVDGRRTITLRPKERAQALEAARTQQTTAEFKQIYAVRAGIEGTIPQDVRRCDIRHARYIGEAKMHLQNVLSAAAINLVRMHDWFAAIPRAKTRISPFVKLIRPASA